MLFRDKTPRVPDGRTTTALDDRLIRAVRPLNGVQLALLSVTIYAAWGLGLPLLFGFGTAWLLTFNTEGALFAALVCFLRLIPIIEARLRRQQLELTTDLRKLSAREFEEVVGEMFRLEGWEEVAEIGGHGEADGNVDLRLRRGSQQRLVQCKQWTARNLGVDEVRKLAGALLRDGCPGTDGILVTSAAFYPAAIAEAKQLGMQLISGEDLVSRLDQQGASDVLSRGATVAWPCPQCAAPMSLAKSGYGWWLRCSATACLGKHDLGQDDRVAVERLVAGP
ncbi:MAG TPA: restriction endonuclease [Solirubrobacteraceae bacterium]|nr:restriction endonuclease [Solirubrobacteraceae bacterium]